ncbi:helix-turn-helix domain-containing protein, partial [Thioclava electrotropha]|uniref:helix-turn-helix domain-containing protein n=1 Tax=Thioclava electrotropha TaxID=1549850 RepID=UPI0023A851A1
LVVFGGFSMRTLLCSALIGLFLAPVVHGNPLADGIATATGLGTADPGMARNRIHGKMLARRAAVADAQRALLEVVQGVRITSGTTVKDAQLESDVIANRVKGLLRNYFTLSENLTEEEGTWLAEVTLGICVSRTAPPCKNSPTINDAVFDQLERTVPSGLYRSSATPETSFSGLVVDLHPTDYELRLGILQTKTEAYKSEYPDLKIAPGVLEFVAHRITSNVRILEGALTRLFAYGSLIGREITMDLAQECLKDQLRQSERKVTVEEIQRKVAEHYNVRLSDLVGPKRLRAIARPRQVAMFLAKSLTTRSLPDIGRRFGGRDHTTIMHGIRKIEELRGTDSQLAEDIELLRRLLES